jgi:hypothetical protein
LNQSTWLGRLGSNVAKSTTTPETVTLSLTNLAPNTTYKVSFDLFVGASWEGNTGPDRWSLISTAGSTPTVLVDATFSLCGVNFQFCASTQTYSDATPKAGLTGTLTPGTGADALFDNGPGTSPNYGIYYFGHGTGNPVLTFNSTGTTATLTFQRLSGSTDSADEYWALDNITVVPQ